MKHSPESRTRHAWLPVVLMSPLVSMWGCADPQAARVSSGRGLPMVDQARFVGAGVPFINLDLAAARDGAVPAGIQPLARDIFTSKDCYLDRDLWSDPRYFRCTSPLALDSQRPAKPEMESLSDWNMKPSSTTRKRRWILCAASDSFPGKAISIQWHPTRRPGATRPSFPSMAGEPMSPGTVIEYRVEDLFGRPWAAIWEEHFEKGMQRPEEAEIFDFD